LTSLVATDETSKMGNALPEVRALHHCAKAQAVFILGTPEKASCWLDPNVSSEGCVCGSHARVCS
jgi:hypothetical protein